MDGRRRRRPAHDRGPPDDRGDRTGPASAATARARAFVADHKDEATALGRAAGEHVHDPDALVAPSTPGSPALADPEYLEGMQMVAPGIGPVPGVRQPLLHAVGSGLRAATRGVRSSTRLDIAAASSASRIIELHWLAYGILERTIRDEPERTWQLVRAESRAAHEWATVDALAHVAALGIVAEPYRWAELEQLVYSPSRWERRLAGSTIATLPFADRVAGRRPEIAVRGLADPGRPHGRRLAGRPEVALVGDPLADHRRSPGHRRVPARRGPDRPGHR